MFCKKCGSQISDDSAFCQFCGQKTIVDKENEKIINERKKYDGEIKKCPNCGEIVDSFTVRCKACGYEFRNVELSNSIVKFKEELEKIYNAPQQNITISNKQLNEERRVDKVVSLINNFVIPNTKEDILEFMFLASSNINIDKIGNLCCSKWEKSVIWAWKSKMEQAYNKALLTLKDEEIFNQIDSLYKNKMQDINKNSERSESLKWVVISFPILLCMMIFLLIMIFLILKYN